MKLAEMAVLCFVLLCLGISSYACYGRSLPLVGLTSFFNSSRVPMLVLLFASSKNSFRYSTFTT